MVCLQILGPSVEHSSACVEDLHQYQLTKSTRKKVCKILPKNVQKGIYKTQQTTNIKSVKSGVSIMTSFSIEGKSL